MNRRGRFAAALAICGTLAAAPAAVGWSVPSDALDLYTGPGAGVVEVSSRDVRADRTITVAAVNAAARTLWRQRVSFECGNCEPILPDGPQADGSYAPIGFSSEGELRGVSAGGTLYGSASPDGCTGLLLADGRCVVVEPGVGGGPGAVRTTVGGGLVWTYEDPALKALDPGTATRTLVASDLSGNLILSRAGGSDTSLLAVLDAATGAVRLRRQPATTAGRPYGLRDGALLVGSGGQLQAVTSSGLTRWSVAAPELSRIKIDAARDRVFVERTFPGRRSIATVTAIDAASGQIAWERRAGVASWRLLATTPSGVLLARDEGFEHELVSANAEGVVVQRRTFLGSLRAAVPGGDGAVYALVESLGFGGSALLHRIPSARKSPARCPRGHSAQLTGLRRGGTFARVLRICSPRAGRVAWQLDASGLARPIGRGVFAAPRGSAQASVYAPDFALGRRLEMRVRWISGVRVVADRQASLPGG